MGALGCRPLLAVKSARGSCKGYTLLLSLAPELVECCGSPAARLGLWMRSRYWCGGLGCGHQSLHTYLYLLSLRKFEGHRNQIG